MKVNDDSTSITNQYDALDRLTNRLDGLGQTRYTYPVLGNGQRTFTEDGPWANDEVTVTNRYGRRAGLRIAQPSGGLRGHLRLGRRRTLVRCDRPGGDVHLRLLRAADGAPAVGPASKRRGSA